MMRYSILYERPLLSMVTVFAVHPVVRMQQLGESLGAGGEVLGGASRSGARRHR